MSYRLSTEERRKEIFNVTLKIIYEKGFYNLTMRKIAAETGISEAAVYRHFDSKEELINGLADRYFCQDKSTEDISEMENAVDKLRDIMMKQLEIFSENPLITVITFQEEIFRAYPQIWRKFKRHRKKREKIIIKIIEKGQSRGEVNGRIDPGAFSVLFMGAVRMIVIKWRISDFSHSIIERGEKVFRELNGLLKGDDV